MARKSNSVPLSGLYVNNPIEPDYQTINLYVPEAYYNNGEINGYQADTAPIFLPNSVGAICRQKRQVMIKRRDGSPGTILVALSKGYVVASVGARGRTLQKEENTPAKHLLPLLIQNPPPIKRVGSSPTTGTTHYVKFSFT